MKRLLGKLICFVTRKHKRGKRIGMGTSSSGNTSADFSCPRCGAKWTRKVRNAS